VEDERKSMGRRCSDRINVALLVKVIMRLSDVM
jgi:hypothetical protein